MRVRQIRKEHHVKACLRNKGAHIAKQIISIATDNTDQKTITDIIHHGYHDTDSEDGDL